ncbi:hypothetical protein [Amycolatopsis benzoatilytica]|uniref:hypothetical protein n=1 Tax=Amycolatopsis benzoatilytica TaxID=346045 RepID=UPI000360611F|nr:hypothetical protein [Amycolatopsis benzoatilytica]
MTTRYKLPSGGTVTLRDPESLKARDTKAFMAKMGAAVKNVDEEDGEAVAAAGVESTDHLIAMLVTDWQIPYETEDGRPWLMPKLDLSLIDELTGPDYGLLMELVKPAQEALMPRNTDPSDYEDPDSPTEPASA